MKKRTKKRVPSQPVLTLEEEEANRDVARKLLCSHDFQKNDLGAWACQKCGKSVVKVD